MSDVGDFTSVK